MNPSNPKALTLMVDGLSHSLVGMTPKGKRTFLIYLISPAPFCKVYFMFKGQEKVQSLTLDDEPSSPLGKLQYFKDSLRDNARCQVVVCDTKRMTNLLEKLELLDRLEEIHDATQ